MGMNNYGIPKNAVFDKIFGIFILIFVMIPLVFLCAILPLIFLVLR